MRAALTHDDLLTVLKAAGDTTRLRLLVLLCKNELNVKDLTYILGQSQPRLSRHLKLLSQAGLIERFKEGSWVYYRLTRHGAHAELIKNVLKSVNDNDKQFTKDQKAAQRQQQKRASEAQAYFKAHAKNWDHIRSQYISESKVEAEMQRLIGSKPVNQLLDLGTGTGRILELFSNQFKQGIGIDINHEMLRHARARLERLNLNHCELRRGDITALDFIKNSADTIIMHQILHFLEEPGNAINEATRLLKRGGKLLIVDFAPHNKEELRSKFAHRWLGLHEDQIKNWLKAAKFKILECKTLKSTTKKSEKTQSSPNAGQNSGLSVCLLLAEKQGAV